MPQKKRSVCHAEALAVNQGAVGKAPVPGIANAKADVKKIAIFSKVVSCTRTFTTIVVGEGNKAGGPRARVARQKTRSLNPDTNGGEWVNGGVPGPPGGSQ